MLVLNKQDKTKWLFGTMVQQKSPVTYLLKLGSQKRLCHVDHLLHSRMTSTNSESDTDDLLDLQLTPASAEPDVSSCTPRLESESTSMPVAMRRSTRKIRTPHRLIEEF